jgi:hypothetical protein
LNSIALGSRYDDEVVSQYIQQIASLNAKCSDLELSVKSYEAFKDIRWPLLRDSVLEYKKEFSSNLTAIPYMSRIIADIMTVDLDRLAWSLSWGNNQARKKKVASLTALKKEKSEEIERIKGDKHLQMTDPKAYYTELTDVLRTYMAERFGFNAMEMTSSEIIDHLLETNDKESINELKYLFETADLVKFAKHSPLMNENDMNLVNAVEFINHTKVEPDPNAKPEPTEITIEEKRSKQGRMVLLGSLIAIGIALLVILFLVSKGIYNLI